MTPTAIIQQAGADGVRLSLSPTGTIKASGDQAAVDRWLQIIRDNKPGILAVLTDAANDTFDRGDVEAVLPHYRWRVAFPDGTQLEVCPLPELTRSEMEARYPAAIIEPMPSTPRRQATSRETAELTALIALVYGNDTEEERAEALTLALADPSSALICYRFIARERAAVRGEHQSTSHRAVAGGPRTNISTSNR